MLERKFNNSQIEKILDQSLIYQCACPAQVCKSLLGLRELYEYQKNCLDMTDTDEKVHSSIAASSARCYEEMENCLLDILEIEGWDLETLEMPQNLVKSQKQFL